MRHSPLLSLLLLATTPALVHAAAVSPPGVNLRWDQCYADHGAWNKNFACNTNTGTERLVGSFELDAELADVSGLEMFVDVGSTSATIPTWWQLQNAGTCRSTSLTFSTFPPAGSSRCVDWAAGQSAGGIGAYTIGSIGSDRARIVIAAAVPQSALATLSPGQEYFAFTLTINHAKTVGTGACAGCLEPMCIFFSGMRVPDQGSGYRIALTRGANYSGSQYATWQQGYPINILTGGCGGMTGGGLICQFMQTTFGCVLATPTSSRGSTWGQVKSLYR